MEELDYSDHNQLEKFSRLRVTMFSHACHNNEIPNIIVLHTRIRFLILPTGVATLFSPIAGLQPPSPPPVATLHQKSSPVKIVTDDNVRYSRIRSARIPNYFPPYPR